MRISLNAVSHAETSGCTSTRINLIIYIDEGRCGAEAEKNKFSRYKSKWHGDPII